MFRDLVRFDAERALGIELADLLKTLPECTDEQKISFIKQFESFKSIFKRFIKGDEVIQWSRIKVLPDEELKPYASLLEPEDGETIRENLESLVVIKLNGGLGTSMGCTGPKSLISVRDELTFLDLTIQQIERLNNQYRCNIPLVLMNSFNTHKETIKVLQKYKQFNIKIHTFMQSLYPRLNRESFLPVVNKIEPELLHNSSPIAESFNQPPLDLSGWYPPGHGDVYRSFVRSGLAEKLLNEGKKWIFISNIDNLGACVDICILNYLLSGRSGNTSPEFVMEVTDKTRGDIKGGTLVEYENGLKLLEIAQVPKDHIDEFTSVRRFRIFNTNNLWVKLDVLIDLVNSDNLKMELILNPKTFASGLNVIQLEEAAGSAIKSFKNALGINVPRSRFLPVKTTSDLLLIMSNLYVLEHGFIRMSPLRNFPSVPLVKLGDDFKNVKDFLSRFESIPDLLDLDHLTITGNVLIGKDVIMKGTVIIIANHGDRICLPPCSFLDNKIVSGNLHILDH